MVILRVDGKMDFRARSAINLVDGLTADHVIVYVRGKKAELGDFAYLPGSIYALGKVKLGAGLVIEGQIFGRNKKIKLGDQMTGIAVPNQIVLP